MSNLKSLLQVGDFVKQHDNEFNEIVFISNKIIAILIEGHVTFLTFEQLDNYAYRKASPEPEKKEWYNDIPEGGRWCMVWRDSQESVDIEKVLEIDERGRFLIIKSYILDQITQETKRNQCIYENATPLTPEEIEKFVLVKEEKECIHDDDVCDRCDDDDVCDRCRDN